MKPLEIEAEIEFTAGEERRREADPRLLHAFRQNEKLRSALYEARVEITELREQVDKLLHPTIEAASLRPGQELVLNEALNVVAVAGYEIQGDVVVLKERLDEKRAVVRLSAGAEKIGVIADPLRSTCLKPGDHLLMDPKSGYLLERLPKTDVEDLALEEVPDIGYRDVGGLAAQITKWRGLWIPAAASRDLSTRMRQRVRQLP
jgi:proteasome-associated ATPase